MDEPQLCISVNMAENHLTFEGLKKADSCENHLIKKILSLKFPLILIRLAWGLKQTQEMNATCPSLVTFRQ